MRDKEIEIIDYINKAVNIKLTLSNDQYSFYDAEDDNYIVEVKDRAKYYKDKMLEEYKFLKCCAIAQEKGKQFLYIVRDPKGVWIYNCSKYIQDIIDFKRLDMPCPVNTEFGNNGKINKVIILLPEDYAVFK